MVEDLIRDLLDDCYTKNDEAKELIKSSSMQELGYITSYWLGRKDILDSFVIPRLVDIFNVLAQMKE